MRFIFFLLILCVTLFADTKISNLPLLGPASVGVSDTVPFVNFSGNETAQLKISDLLTVPSLQSPTFTGTVTGNLFVGPLTGTASGNTTYSANQYGVVLSGASNAMTVLPPNSSTALPLISGGSSANPSWATLSIAGGGTGQTTKSPAFNALSPMTTLGDIIYGGASGTGTRLAGNTAASLKFLTQTGTGSVSAAPSWSSLTVPTVQKFTSSSGTYTTATSPGPIYIKITMVGGGGGGGGAGAGSGSGGGGGNTTFGTTLLVANGGNGGGGAGGDSGSGGTASLGSGPIGIALSGGYGEAAAPGITGFTSKGTMGCSSPLGGAGSSLGSTGAGTAAITNSGSGGGGGYGATAGASGAGGGCGGYVSAIITAPSATYSYAVGVAGTAGAGANGGGAGGSGIILVEEFYQ